MKSIYKPFLILGIMVLFSFGPDQAEQWHITDTYKVKFEAKNAKGSFGNLKGVIYFEPDDLASSKFNMEIEVASIQTGFFIKNNHAKSSNWFDAENYPTINFISTNIVKSNDGYIVTGNLKMHGVTREVSIPFTFVDNTFTGSFSVNRLDFNVGSEDGLSAKVPSEITVHLSVPVID